MVLATQPYHAEWFAMIFMVGLLARLAADVTGRFLLNGSAFNVNLDVGSGYTMAALVIGYFVSFPPLAHICGMAFETQTLAGCGYGVDSGGLRTSTANRGWHVSL